MSNFANPAWSGTGGKYKGATYVRKNGGYFGRTIRHPFKSNTNSQQFQRTAFSLCARSWLTVLTHSEQNDWKAFAAGFVYNTGLIPTTRIKGINHYCRQSQFLNNFGGSGNIGATIGSGTTQQTMNITTAQLELDNPVPGFVGLRLEGTTSRPTSTNCLIGVYFWTPGNANCKRYIEKLPILTMFFIPAGPAGLPWSQDLFVFQLAGIYSGGMQIPLGLVIWDNGNMSDWYRQLIPVIQF